MASRTLGLATVMLLTGWFADPAAAQNLEAGKSPAQLFSGNCSACHRSPRGLIKSVPQGSLPGFLREHYTTSKDMAATMAGYLAASGGADPRGGGGLTRQGQEAKSGARQQPDQATPAQQGRRQQPGQQEAARPDADGLAPQPSRRRPRGPDTPGVEATAPADSGPAAGPGNRAKQKLGKRGRPPHEEPKPEPAKEIAKDPAKDEPNKDTASPADTTKPDSAKPEAGGESVKEAAKPDTTSPGSGKPESGKSEQVGTDPTKPLGKPSEPSRESKPDTAAVSPRHDPVPQVTPAPKPDAAKPDAPAQQDAKAPEHPSAPPAPAATPSPSAGEAPAPAPAITSSPPLPPAGPPTPPISQ